MSKIAYFLIFMSFLMVNNNSIAYCQIQKRVIDLDSLPVVEVYAENVIGSEKNQKIMFYHIEKLDIDRNGSVYVCDSGNNRIPIFNNSGRLIRIFGREGGGPGEFREPNDIVITDSSVYVSELKNARIQVFERNLRYYGLFAVAPTFSFDIAANDSYIYVPNHIDMKKKSIMVFEAKKPFRFVRSFLDLRKPAKGENYTVMTLNSFTLDCDTRGNVYVVRCPFPFLYIFDPNGKKLAEIEFRGKHVEELRTPIRQKITTGATDPIKIFIEDIFLDEKNNLFLLTSRNYVIYFDRKENKVLKIFPYPDRKRNLKRIWYRGIARWKNHLYITDKWNEALLIFPFNI